MRSTTNHTPTWALSLLLAGGCGTPAVPDVTRPAAQVVPGADGRFVHDGAPYSGYATTHAASGELLERTGFLDGQRHGLHTVYFLRGTPRVETMYHRGQRHGRSRTWWFNGTLRSESTFVDGLLHGTHRAWYETGAPFKEMNLINGEEAGLQRAWLPDGTLYNNYEVRDGRTYGLQRAQRCFELTEETIVASPDLD